MEVSLLGGWLPAVVAIVAWGAFASGIAWWRRAVWHWIVVAVGALVVALTVVWFLVEEGRILISAQGQRQKTKNLIANPLCSLLIHSPDTENYYVEIRGSAVVVPDLDYVVADRIAVRYNADFRTYDGPNSTRVIIEVIPERLLISDVRG